jgi:hypothetical protein
MKLGRHATDEQVAEWVRLRMAFRIPRTLWLALQAAEDGKLHVSETYMSTAELSELELIALSGDFWTLTAHGQRLMNRRRCVARRAWSIRHVEKLARLTDAQIAE